MALTAAEKQRLYRQRRDSDPRKRSQYLLKEKDRYKQKKECHKIRPISQLSSREKRAQRKIWRVAQQRSREQRKTKANSPSTTPTPSRQKLSGKKAKKRNRAACYRQIAQLKNELNNQKRLTERYRKQCTRMKTGLQEKNTPNSKTKAMLRGSVVTEQIRRELLFHNTIVEHLKQKYKSGRKEREKQVIAKILTGKIVKKYRMQELAQKRFGFSKRRWQRSEAASIDFERKKRVYKLTDDVKGSAFNFFTRDDVSRVTTGKKDTITRNSRKEQKRFLTDSLKNLHTKFLSENPNNVSYSSFCSLRPFWVLHPRTSDRETCLCKKHENTSFQAAKLHQLKVIDTVDVEQLALALNCCDETCKGCSYEECDDCKDKKLVVNLIDGSEEVFWWKWVTKVESKEKKTAEGEMYSVSFNITVKEKLYGSKEALLDQFERNLSKLRKHVFNIRHQFSEHRKLRQNMRPNECIIHIDFAENYMCKYDTEIQSVHFGGSHKQTTLHTGVLYIGQEKPFAFCTVSDSTQHDPSAIWAYLDPVLSHIKNKYPTISVTHFFSDGPTTQYRQKGNFYLFSTKVFEKGFVFATWNFYEAGHGKGAPDGVGGALKRTADSLVAHGTSIPSPLTFFEKLKESGTTVAPFYTSEAVVEAAAQSLPTGLCTVPGTMQIHQIITHTKREINYRDVSCFCNFEKNYCCDCFAMKKFNFSSRNITDSDQETVDIVPVGNARAFSDLIRKWCVALYDNEPYPGIIQSFDETDVEIKVMHRVGNNRFFWPAREDILWYGYNQVLSLIPKPKEVSSRHVEVEPRLWDLIRANLR